MTAGTRSISTTGSRHDSELPRIGGAVGDSRGWMRHRSLASGDERSRADRRGHDVSANMLSRAREAAPLASIVRARAGALPWRAAAFDRIVCVNALHHFTDREGFFAEARRILESGGGLLTIGLDPHTERDEWWVYDFFPETRAIDRARFVPVRIIRGEITKAGFAWAESFETDRLETQFSLREAFPDGVERAFTSQLTVLTDAEFGAGLARMRDAGDDVRLTADLRLYATLGWLS